MTILATIAEDDIDAVNALEAGAISDSYVLHALNGSSRNRRCLYAPLPSLNVNASTAGVALE